MVTFSVKFCGSLQEALFSDQDASSARKPHNLPHNRLVSEFIRVKPASNGDVARINGCPSPRLDVVGRGTDGIISVADALVRPRSDWSSDALFIAAYVCSRAAESICVLGEPGAGDLPGRTRANRSDGGGVTCRAAFGPGRADGRCIHARRVGFHAAAACDQRSEPAIRHTRRHVSPRRYDLDDG